VKTLSHTAPFRSARKSRLAPLVACLTAVLALPVNAAVSLPATPMQTNNGVAPNIWFILDDSGSMVWRYMYNPDIASLLGNNGAVVSSRTGDNVTKENTYNTTGINLLAMYDQSYVTNTIYYNPNQTYRGWQNADGSYKADTPFTAAFSSATLADAASGVLSLAGTQRTFYVPLATNTNLADATQYARYTFEADGTVQSCTWVIADGGFTACTPQTSFAWDGVTRNVDQEKQNFANWVSYHRTRSKVAKAGASYAFNDTSVFNADNDFRVGYTTIWAGANGLTDQTFRIPVATNNGLFTDTNRTTWFDRLFNSGASLGTPLIPALTRAGEYFKEVGENGPWGPQKEGFQYECRQNFTILTTDGYWNSSGTPTIGNADNEDGTTYQQFDTAGELLRSDKYTAANPFKDGFSNTLADVAMYYWKTDLRPQEQMKNNVPFSATVNPAFWQHMVTFGISIGLKGTLDLTATGEKIEDKEEVLWPNPNDKEDLERIDDLYHATVNGRGKFIAASDPQQFSDGLGAALRAISEAKGSGSNATVTGTSTNAGTQVFQASYFTAGWYGVLKAFAVSEAGVDTTEALWTASIPEVGTRNIFTSNGAAGATFPTIAQTTALTADVADYIRGDRTKEQSADGALRNRTSLLGTIVNSSPTYVKASDTVFAGANDGMLHAFNATTGEERFAYVPSGVNLAKLKEYSQPNFTHSFFVDGPIVTSTDRELIGTTVLVGTLGRGGKGLYALDVTAPATFGTTKVLWDKNGAADADMGQILGKPLIAKLNNGNTGLIVANGLNSTNESAVLYVFDLVTGVQIAKINTGANTNNGLSTPRGWDEDGNGTVDIVYAGDFNGNLWKFDLRATAAPATNWKVADNNGRLYAPTTGLSQPVTGAVTIGVDPATDKRWVFFGTGRFLTTSDITDTSRQAWYGVIDDETATTPATVTRTDLTSRNIALSGAGTRAFEPNSPLPTGSKGWYVDLDAPPDNTLQGERMVGDQQIVKNVLIASSIIPSTANPCQPGRGFINALDAFTGTSLPTGLFDVDRNGTFGNAGDTLGKDNTAVGSIDLGVGMVTDPALLDKLLIAGGSLATLASTPLDPALYGGRISWREIIRR
jgi:type IV pilus assembly protein PilY1